MITELDLLMRALASRTRLRILAAVLRAPPARVPQGRGILPCEIARRLNVSRSSVSQHLRVLLRLHLVRYWKRGVLKYYSLSRVKPSSLRGRLMDRIAKALPENLPPVFPQALKDLPKGRPRRAKPRRLGEASAPSLAPLWADLTCYSHFRRILMLRHLLKHGEATVGELAAVAHIHPLTAAYHVSKLLRRHEVQKSPNGVRLCSPNDHPLRRILHEAAGSRLFSGREEPGA